MFDAILTFFNSILIFLADIMPGKSVGLAIIVLAILIYLILYFVRKIHVKNRIYHELISHDISKLKWKTDKKYDLVCSFGFIEHFTNAEEIIKKHIDLVKKGGKVIVEVPNFSGVPGFFHKIVDGPSLKQHNTSIMNLDFFRKIAKQNNLKVLYLGYYGSFHFQWGYGRRETANLLQKGIYALLKLISKLTIHIKMRNKMSNYIFFIAEK